MMLSANQQCLESLLRGTKARDAHLGHHIVLVVLALDPQVFSILRFDYRSLLLL